MVTPKRLTPLLDRLPHVLNHLLGVAKHHHGLVHIEQFIVQPGISRRHGALVDDELFYMDKTMMVFGDAKKVVEDMGKAIE